MRSEIMKFAFYEKINIEKLEQELRILALANDYKFDKEVEALNDDEVINKGYYDISRKLIKVFGDKCEITTFSINHHKHTYFITVGESEDKNLYGISIIFYNKPIKQLAKAGIATLMLATLPASGVILPLAGFLTSIGLTTSSVKNILTFKGPLKDEISEIVDEVAENFLAVSEKNI